MRVFMLVACLMFAGCEMTVKHEHEIKPVKLDFNLKINGRDRHGHESGDGVETDNSPNMGAGTSIGPDPTFARPG